MVSRDHNLTDTTAQIKPRLDLDSFLYALRDERYVIAKSFELDSYHPGEDLDLLCEDNVAVARAILAVAQQYADLGYEIRVNESRSTKQVQIDFFWSSTLEYRFDLIDKLPRYPRVSLKASYFHQLMQDRRSMTRSFDRKLYSIYVPHELDDLLLRYVEYAEYFHVRSDKIKHIKHIQNALRRSSGAVGFIMRLHRFTDLPQPADLARAGSIGNWSTRLGDTLTELRTTVTPTTRRLAELTTRTLRDPVGMTGKLVHKTRSFAAQSFKRSSGASVESRVNSTEEAFIDAAGIEDEPRKRDAA